MMLCDLSLPRPWPGANKRLILGAGAPISPLVRLSTFSPDEFENFVLEWVHDYLAKQYNGIKRCGGAGDMGRDVVGWIDTDGTPDRRWDNYQCKHYKDPLTPTDFWVELGKLCYYTFQKAYTVPQNYFIVTHQGVGTKLLDLIGKPEELRQELFKNWDGYCSNKISKSAHIQLTGPFRTYIENFDFSIIKEVAPLDLIEQHSQTRYHAAIFGTNLKPRPAPSKPPETVEFKEIRYIQQIYEAFADHMQTPVSGLSDFAHRSYLKNNFENARVCFYSAESLREFARDNLPDDTYFEDLLDQFLEGLSITILKNHPDGYVRMTETGEKAVSLQITSNGLQGELRPYDRIGICHQLANEDRLRWVQP